MCGITGFLDLRSQLPTADYHAIIDYMTQTLAHRGPDSAGSWVDRKDGIALGHRRLAIIDISPEGQQPMRSVDGRFVLVFNGEIYNFQSL